MTLSAIYSSIIDHNMSTIKREQPYLMIELRPVYPLLSFTRKDQLEIVFQIPYDEFNGREHLRETLAPSVDFATGRWRLVKGHGCDQRWIDLYVPLTVEPCELESGDIVPIAQESAH